MRKLIVCTLLLLVATFGYSQEPAPSQPLTKQDYLQKSKSQKTAAFIFLGIGAGLVAIAAPGNVSFDVLPVLAIGAAAATACSISLFIGSAKNKRRAMEMTSQLTMQKLPAVANTGPLKRSLPGVSVRLNF